MISASPGEASSERFPPSLLRALGPASSERGHPHFPPLRAREIWAGG